jgi:hypothetical protein
MQKDGRKKGDMTAFHALLQRDAENPVGIPLDWKKRRQQPAVIEAEERRHAERPGANRRPARGPNDLTTSNRRPVDVV